MTDWGWIAFGYTVVYGVVAAYAMVLMTRLRRARRHAPRPAPSGVE